MRKFTKFLNEERGYPKELDTILTILENARRISQLAHWNVRGPNFLELHKLFGEIYDYTQDKIDTIAERILAINNQALVKIKGSIEAKAVSDANKNIDALVAALETKQLEDMLVSLDETTSNIVQEIIAQLDKFIWKLNSSKG